MRQACLRTPALEAEHLLERIKAPTYGIDVALGNADAIGGASDAAVARDSLREELCQRRGRDDDALGRRDLARRLVSTQGGTAHSFAWNGLGGRGPAAEFSPAGPCGWSIGGGSPGSNGTLPFLSRSRAWRSHLPRLPTERPSSSAISRMVDGGALALTGRTRTPPPRA